MKYRIKESKQGNINVNSRNFKTFFHFVKFELNFIKEIWLRDLEQYKRKKVLKKSISETRKYPIWTVPEAMEITARYLSEYNWFFELPVQRISEDCKKKIKDLVILDTVNITDEKGKDLNTIVDLNESIENDVHPEDTDILNQH